MAEVLVNDIFKEASWNDEFQYFELMDNDGAYDKIQTIQIIKNYFILNIKREFQEGWTYYQVKFSYNIDRWRAEYLNYGETQY